MYENFWGSSRNDGIYIPTNFNKAKINHFTKIQENLWLWFLRPWGRW